MPDPLEHEYEVTIKFASPDSYAEVNGPDKIYLELLGDGPYGTWKRITGFEASTVQRKTLRAGYYVVAGRGYPYRLQNDGTLEYWDGFTWKESSYTLPNLREHGKFIGPLGAKEA